MKKAKSIEDMILRLNELSTLISDPNTSLSDALKYYSEAAELVNTCNENLKQTKIMISEIDAKILSASVEE